MNTEVRTAIVGPFQRSFFVVHHYNDKVVSKINLTAL